jgi:hypothetical protein
VQIDDEAIELLKKQIEVSFVLSAEEKRKNDLAEQALKQAEIGRQSREVADRNRLKIALDTNEKVEVLAQQLPLFIAGFVEWQKEDAKWKDRLDEILLLLLTGKGNGNKSRIDELKRELEQSHTEQLIVQEYENLHELENQAAQYGVDIPIRLVNQIKKSKAKIDELGRKLAG